LARFARPLPFLSRKIKKKGRKESRTVKKEEGRGVRNGNKEGRYAGSKAGQRQKDRKADRQTGWQEESHLILVAGMEESNTNVTNTLPVTLSTLPTNTSDIAITSELLELPMIIIFNKVRLRRTPHPLPSPSNTYHRHAIHPQHAFTAASPPPHLTHHCCCPPPSPIRITSKSHDNKHHRRLRHHHRHNSTPASTPIPILPSSFSTAARHRYCCIPNITFTQNSNHHRTEDKPQILPPPES
jgi:hypothetical protein